MNVTFLLLIFLIGVLTGLRSLTPTAATAWGGRLGWLKLGAGLSWLATTPAAVIFGVLALAEIANDKRASTPPRTALPGVVARVVMGGFAGACLASASGQSLVLGIIVAIIGAVAGTYGGYQARTRLVKAFGSPDFVIAVIEDLIAVGCSFWVVSRF